MLVETAVVDPSPLCPDPSCEKWREEEERAQDPPLCLSSSCTTPTAMTAPEPTHSTPQPRPNPPAREQGRHARCCSTRVARAPAPVSYWVPSPSSLRPIKASADQTNQLAPLPATSQTPSPLPARSRLTSPSPPVRYWTRRAPLRSTSLEQADAGNWWRSLAGVFSARRLKLCFPYARRRRRRLLRCTQVSSTLAVEHDAPAPLDLDRSVAYWFGADK
jgi:hypothetical protein